MNELVAAQERAARVAGAADLLDVRMLNASCELEELPGDADLTFGVSLEPRVEHDSGDDYFVVRIEFKVKIERLAQGDDEGDEVATEEDRLVAFINSEWAALYDLVGLDTYEPTEEEFQAYADTAATLTLFPYVREFVSSTTNRLGLPKLVLPVHRMPSPWHPDEGEANG